MWGILLNSSYHFDDKYETSVIKKIAAQNSAALNIIVYLYQFYTSIDAIM